MALGSDLYSWRNRGGLRAHLGVGADETSFATGDNLEKHRGVVWE